MRNLMMACFFASVYTAACIPAGVPALPARSSPDSLMQILGSANYRLDLASTGSVTLAHGKYVGPTAPGSATRLIVHLTGTIATGDLNGDGVEDVAVILVVDPGGSGTFWYVAAVVRQDRTLHGVATARLGDRIEVKSLKIRDGYIEVTFLERAPGEAMVTSPTLEVTQSYRLSGSGLERYPN